jgi:riboflavin biosynthesis RibT protein
VGKKMILALGKLIGEQVTLTPSQAIESYFDKCFEDGEKKETNS